MHTDLFYFRGYIIHPLIRILRGALQIIFITLQLNFTTQRKNHEN